MKQRNRYGYTLIELIVVLCLMGIIFGIGGSSLSGYVRYSKFKHNNESAQSLFSVSQSALTHAKANGQLEELLEVCQASESSSNNASFRRLSDSQIICSDESEKENLKNRLYSVILTKDFNEKRLNGEKVSGKYAENAVFDLINPYLYDKSYLNATICIEFDPQDGVVYSVSYSVQASDMSYTNSSNTQAVPLLLDRSYATRKENLLGYYGAAGLSVRAPGDSEKPVIATASLINDETLYFKWNMSARYKDLTQALYYTLQVYDAQTGKIRLSMIVNQSDIDNNFFTNDTQLIDCKVTKYNEQGQAITDESGNPITYDAQFPAYITETGVGLSKTPVMNLVLDAVDLNTTSLSQTENNSAMNESYSISRFGIDATNIYVRVQASGEGYRSSAWKESNTSHMYMASEEKIDTGTFVMANYGIKNARHLYNLRYMEEKLQNSSDIQNWNYIQQASFAWDGSNGLIAHGAVYSGTTVVTEDESAKEKAFPSISTLSSKATYQGYQNQEYEIQNLTIINQQSESIADADQTPTGLFGRNNGTIKDVGVTDATVIGGNRTGIVCGINTGNLENIRTSGSVTGDSFVGGICGQDASNGISANVRTYEGLENNADVTGKFYIGGILGSLNYVTTVQDAAAPVQLDTNTVSDCKNTGKIQCNDEDGGIVGGIVGYNDGGVITGCNSTQSYTEAEVTAAVETLKGTCVGGIVGLDKAGTVENCSTGKTAENGYIIGKKMVGGIIGLKTDASNNHTTVLDGQYNNQSQTNGSNVIADTYAGGIVGANAEIRESKTFDAKGNLVKIDCTVTESDTYQENYILQNWNNTGIVIAKTAYAGGIAGYNIGLLDNCNTRVNTASTSGQEQLELLNKFKCDGDYIGGIVGYNGGMIKKSQGQSIVSVLYGGRFIGGIAGYNAPSGMIEDGIAVAGAYLEGEAFVGSVAGCNTSSKLLENQNMTVKFNSLEGDYFVGGVFGANIVGGLTSNQSVEYGINSSFGSISGKSFIGGVIGYNQLTKTMTSDDEKTLRAMKLDNTETAYQSMNAFKAEAGQTSAYRLTIQDTSVSGTAHTPSIQNMKAETFVGGIVGYSHKNTALTIQSLRNNTPITVTGSVKVDGFDNKQSFAGGIIGWAEDKVIITRCYNSTSADISAKEKAVGTYIGALTAANDGLILNCSIKSFGSSTISYLGGLAGINTKTGKIEMHLGAAYTASGTISGKSNVGGMVSNNEGEIYVTQSTDSTCSYDTSVRAYGDTVGGIAAKNSGSIDFHNVELNGSVRSPSGDEVGGAVGHNMISDSSQKFVVSNTSNATVHGSSYVGGYIGKGEWTQDGTYSYSKLKNNAAITADVGTAGGIIGIVQKSEKKAKITFDSCQNHGVVTSNGEGGFAGGIIGIIDSEYVTLSKCSDYAAVSAMKGMNGGIAAQNAGTIENCTVDGSEIKLGDYVDYPLAGMEYCGGIAGINTGTIQKSNVYNITIANARKSSDGSQIGGITGANSGIIKDCQVGTAKAAVTVGSCTSKGGVGGIVGKNTGKVIGSSEGTSIYANITFLGSEASNQQGYLGGIVGENSSTVENYHYNGNLRGYAGSDYGFGGIAGINQGKAEIRSCMIGAEKDTDITVDGYSNSDVSVGGAAGVNKNIIDQVYLGNVDITVGYGYTGGIVGVNTGLVSNSGSNTGTDSGTVHITQDRGHLGGIIGWNKEGGQATSDMTGDGWTVKANYHATDNTVAGIIGYNLSGKDMTDLTNYASVTKTKHWSDQESNVVAGIIGRQEVVGKSSWKISNCTNYGKILGHERVGGILGQWKYAGGTIQNCENYGTITANNKASAGIVAYVFKATTEDLNGISFYVDSCKNFGAISSTSSAAAGIVGRCDDSANMRMSISNCVNAGNLTSSSTKVVAGIVGGEGVTGKVYVDKCQNYGKGTAGMKVYAVSNHKLTSVQNCFSVSDIADEDGTILASDASDENTLDSDKRLNYYFTKEDTNTEDSGAQYMTVTANNTKSGNSVARLVDGRTFKDAETNRWVRDSYGETDLNFEFVGTKKVSSVDIYFYANSQQNGTRYYQYTIYGTTKNGNEIKLKEYGKDVKNQFGYYQGSVKPMTTTFDEVELTSVRIHISACSKTSGGYSIYEVEFNGEENKPGAILSKNNVGFSVTEQADQTYQAYAGDILASIGNLSVNPLTFTGTGKELYEAVKDQIYNFYYDSYSGKPGVPTNVTLEEMSAQYKVNWKRSSGAYGYQVELYLFDSQEEADAADTSNKEMTPVATFNTTQSSSATASKLTALFAKDEAWHEKYVRAKVIAYSRPDQEMTEENSSYAWSASTYVKEKLETPDVYMELIDIDDEKDTYRLVLNNASDYTKQGIDLSQLNIQISGLPKAIAVATGTESNTLTFKANECIIPDDPTDKQTGAVFTVNTKNHGSSGVSNSDIHYNIIVKTQAIAAEEAEDLYEDSELYSAQTSMLYGSVVAAGGSQGRANEVTWGGFTGNTPKNLAYTLKLKYSKWQAYERQELQVYDKDTDCYVAVSSGETRVSGTHEVELNNLPNDIMSEDIVKAVVYPWATQNHGVQYGHIVGENMTAEDVREILESGQEGYLVERNEDGTYTVRYSIMFTSKFFYERSDENIKNPAQINEVDMTKLNQQPEPVIDFKDSETLNERDHYKVIWDEGKTGGTYNVQITGIRANGDEIVLQSINETTEHEVDLTDIQKCTRILVEVTRLGTTDSKGNITYGTSAEATYELYPPLTSIAAPKVTLTDKNELYYDISWEGLDDSSEQTALVRYAVCVNGTEVASADKDVESLRVNLEDFAGQTVTVAVKAIAKARKDYSEDDDKYTNSYLDYGQEITIQQRMSSPDTNIISLSEEYKANDYLTLKNFLVNGVDLNIDDKDTDIVYLIDARVVDQTKDEDDPDYVLVDFGNNNQCKQTSDGSVFTFNRDLKGWDGTLAGKELQVKIRKTKTDEISSVWTETKTFILPRVQLESVSMEHASTTISGTEIVTEGTDTTPNAVDSLALKTVTWTPVSYADAYQVKITEAGSGKEHEIWLRKSGSHWQMYDVDAKKEYSNSGKWIQWRNLDSETEGRTTTYTNKDSFYEAVFTHSTEGRTFVFETESVLTVEEKQSSTSITLQLPDTDNYHGQAFRSTSEVKVRAVMLTDEEKDGQTYQIIDQKDAQYQIAKWMRWYRVTENTSDNQVNYSIKVEEEK